VVVESAAVIWSRDNYHSRGISKASVPEQHACVGLPRRRVEYPNIAWLLTSHPSPSNPSDDIEAAGRSPVPMVRSAPEAIFGSYESGLLLLAGQGIVCTILKS
jgi:hypothetical protein